MKISTINQIISAVCREFGISEIEILSDRKSKETVLARFVGYYLAKELTFHSLKAIAGHFRRTDHNAVLRGIQSLEGRMGGDLKLAERINRLKSALSKQ